MSKFIELLDEASEKENSVEIMSSWGEIFDYYLNKVEDSHPAIYSDMMDELYVTIHGEHLNEGIAKKWVHSMKPVGEHWNIEDTSKALPTLDKIEGYVAANMIYNDYYDIVKSNETVVLKMAIDWINDSDAEENKLYNYWKYIAKRG